jgi:glycosyltransferase involved in cell wall biosynthesis
VGDGALRIAWFSPLNTGALPGPSVAAYCSDEFLPLLGGRFEIEPFHAGFECSRYGARHFLTAYKRHSERPFDLFFYQIEDVKACDFVRIHMGLMPGVVLFHDLIFRSDGPEPILNSPWQETLSKYHTPERPWPARENEYKSKGPLGYREAGYAAAALFSNPGNHVEYRSHIEFSLARASGGAPPSAYLPFPVDPALCRPRRPGGEAVGFCGSPQIEHRAHKLLQAMEQAGGRTARLYWLIDEAERALAEALLREFEGVSAVLIPGRSPKRWMEMLGEVDIAVHTLFSVYGAPGPYLAMSMMAGRAVIVTRFASTEFIPDGLVFKIAPGATEAAEMTQVLRALLADRVNVPSAKLSAFARELHDRSAAARELAGVFERAAPYMRTVMRRWDALEEDARRSLLLEASALGGGAEQLGGQSVWELTQGPVFEGLGWS